MTPIDTSKGYYCHRDLTVKYRSTWFHMERKDMGLQDPGRSPIKQYPKTFTSLYAASKVTGISNKALRNACEKHKVITRRKGESAKHEIEWFYICRKCDPSPPKKSKGELEDYVVPIWSWDENNHLKL